MEDVQPKRNFTLFRSADIYPNKYIDIFAGKGGIKRLKYLPYKPPSELANAFFNCFHELFKNPTFDRIYRDSFIALNKGLPWVMNVLLIDTASLPGMNNYTHFSVLQVYRELDQMLATIPKSLIIRLGDLLLSLIREYDNANATQYHLDQHYISFYHKNHFKRDLLVLPYHGFLMFSLTVGLYVWSIKREKILAPYRKLDMAISTLKRKFLYTYWNPRHPRGQRHIEKMYQECVE